MNKAKGWLAIFCTGALLVVGLSTATTPSADPMPSPYVLVTYQSTNYLGEVATLQENEALYRDTPLWEEFAGDLGTAHSYIGNYRQALAYFDSMAVDKLAHKANGRAFTGCVPQDALSVIVQRAANSRAVFINEAHHVPQHRVLTRAVLKALYDQGFRYFAAETLTDYDYSLNERGYPLLKQTGYYTDEPLYGDLIRKALELGYTVIPYESQGGDESQYEREAAQARNLVDRILKNDPEAKLVVHAGYGHIYERATPEWTPMALLFTQLSGIDPLTVDQAVMSEHSRPRYETASYREALTTFNIDRPTVFECAGEPWVSPGNEGLYDLTVFLPRSEYVNGRPTWLSLGGERTPYLLPADICRSRLRCLVQARFADESQDAVPVDQLEVRKKTSRAALMLPGGRFAVRVLDINANSIAEFEIRR